MKKSLKLTAVIIAIMLFVCVIIPVNVIKAATADGDVNGDGVLNFADIVVIRINLLNSKVETVGFDLNSDGKTNLRDLVKLKKMLQSVASDDWVDGQLGDQGSHDTF